MSLSLDAESPTVFSRAISGLVSGFMLMTIIPVGARIPRPQSIAITDRPHPIPSIPHSIDPYAIRFHTPFVQNIDRSIATCCGRGIHAPTGF
jgi:hypothetical protein